MQFLEIVVWIYSYIKYKVVINDRVTAVRLYQRENTVWFLYTPLRSEIAMVYSKGSSEVF